LATTWTPDELVGGDVHATVTVEHHRPGGEPCRDDVTVSAPGTALIGDLLSQLGPVVTSPVLAGGVLAGRVLVDGSAVDPNVPIHATSLRDGSLLRLTHDDAALDSTMEPPARGQPTDWQLRVVSGPCAGSVHELVTGVTTIGRASDNGIRLDDPAMSRRHAVLEATADDVRIADAGSTNGTDVDGSPVGTHPALLAPGSRLHIGESTLLLAVANEPPAVVTRGADGSLSINRPPRLDAPDAAAQPVVVEFPEPPAQSAPTRLPLIATLAPLVAGLVLAAVTRRLDYLLFTVVSPVMMAAQWLADRIGTRRTRREQRAVYQAAVADATARLAARVRAEEERRRRCFPDPAAIAQIARTPTTRLWERRRRDADFLHLRLGGGTLPTLLRVTGSSLPPLARDVPLTVDLRRVGVLGIAGPPARAGGLARSLVCQVATLHSPRDVAVVLLADPSRADSWAWIRWLPHVRPAGTATCSAMVGLDPETLAARLAELAAVVSTRSGHEGSSARQLVVVIDGAQPLRELAGLADVLANGPDVGVLAICLDAAESCLPAECGAVVTLDSDAGTRVRLRIAGESTQLEAVADGLSTDCAEAIARALAPLRDAHVGFDALPAQVRWLALAQLADAVEQADLADTLAERWRGSGAAGTAVPLGAGTDGPFVVDLARDGPHALVAGTTGSGKSELLQTLVVALAVSNRPDELTLVLVDYKGGAAFGPCASLPHTVGVVTDLDGALVERALVSLRAELKHRELLLAEAGVAGIDAYRQAGGRLARLVIVVDEFASLADELPDFVAGLVDIAQRGRSLGVHLVLATQRPEGVVSADIRANTNLRICLAVTRDAESRDVIDAPDAARISRDTPGRGYARTGHSELHAFQAGRVAGIANTADAPTIAVRPSPFRCLGRAQTPDAPTAINAAAATDLDLLVAACRDAASRLGVEAPASPWLPPLPPIVVAGTKPDDALTATLATVDLPDRQAQQRWRIDLAAMSHLLVVGSPRSGRTTCLRTLAGLLARSTTTADLHLYGLDCGGGSLGPLAALPHCGAVVAGHEVDRVRRLLSVLGAEVENRRHRLASDGYASIGEQRAGGTAPLPHVVLLVDGWEAFAVGFDEIDAGAPVDALFTLLRDGAGVGVHVVATCDRAGLVGRLASAVETRLVLRLADRGDFGLVGLPMRGLPADLPAGRGFRTPDLVETQVRLLDSDPAGAAQCRALAAIAARARDRDADVPRAQRPRRVDVLPKTVALADLSGPASHQPPVGSAAVVLGLGGDELGPISVDLLESGPGFVIAGPPRSGRSSALGTVGSQLRARGWQVLAVTARPSPVGAFAEAAFDADDPGFEAAADGAKRLAVLVDDAELVSDSVAGRVLDRLTRTARDARRLVIVAGTTEELSVGFRGFAVDARKSRAGLLLSPRSPYDGEVLGIRLPKGTAGASAAGPPTAGRGLLVVAGAAIPIQVATPP
jgi:S-DNA-T family DNA segregation ATPase FtsK/SpoIIIE